MSLKSTQQVSSLTTPLLDIDKYSGRWYEVAKLPLIYEKYCNGAIADYAIKTNKKGEKYVSVVNTCLVNDKPVRTRCGKARIVDSDDPGKLSLIFDDGKPSNPGPSHYWVFSTDYNTYSIVGVPSGNLLWVLSRKKQMPTKQLRNLLLYSEKLGFPIRKMTIWSNRIC